ncbi:MAG: hypothetical protein IPL20_01415 [Saprospiraceae bacterium]|nr:hypothetical protein [Saprospiraceae bacterium]
MDTLKEIEIKADAVDKKLTEHEGDIKAIAGIKKDVADAKKDIADINITLPTLSQQSNTAKADSATAIAQSQLNNQMLIAFNAIGKLKKN